LKSPSQSLAATAVFQWFMAETEGPSATERSAKPGVSFFGVVKLFNPALRERLVSDIFIRFCERLPYAFVIPLLWAHSFGRLVVAFVVRASRNSANPRARRSSSRKRRRHSAPAPTALFISSATAS
jgi:hypothetical protein